MSSIFDRSIISVPVYDAVYQRNTGRVPSIYFRRTHRQKGESRGKFNLFIAGSKRLPSPSTSLPAHEVVVREWYPWYTCISFSAPLHRLSPLRCRSSNQILALSFSLVPSSVAYHCSTNERKVPCKEGRKGLCDAAQLARAISQQWFSLSLSVSLKGVYLSPSLSASIERCDDQPTPSSNSWRSERLLWVGKEKAGCSSKRCSRCTRLGVFEARVAEIFLPLFHSAPS